MVEFRKLQPAFYARDRWPRGVRYVRRHTITTQDEEAVDFTGWTTLDVGVEGSLGTQGLQGLATVRFDTEVDGITLGVIIVDIDGRSLELDRPLSVVADNSIKYTIRALNAQGVARVVTQVTARISDTAFI